LGIHNWTQIGKGTYTRALCQKNEGSVGVKQRPIKMCGRTTYRTLSPTRTPFQTGIGRWSHLWKVPRSKWFSHTYPMWLWGHSLIKISSPGPVLHRTKRLLWCPHKQSPTFHSSVGLIRRWSKGKHNRSLMVAVQETDYYDPPLIHSLCGEDLMGRHKCTLILVNKCNSRSTNKDRFHYLLITDPACTL
jgi:hypothetical protein